MSWIIGVLLVIAGAIIGFFVARYTQTNGQSGNLEEQVEKSQQQLSEYQREVAEHFATANAMMEQLSDTQQKLQSYLNQSAELLQQPGSQGDLPFFSEDNKFRVTIRKVQAVFSLMIAVSPTKKIRPTYLETFLE